MKNHNLYIQPSWENPEKKHALDVSFKGISEYESEIVRLDERKAKRKDVPPMYRENIGEIVLNVAAWTFFILFTLNCILFFAKVL